MTTEWKDLLTMQDVAKAQTDGWEIERLGEVSGEWEQWAARGWNCELKYRGRPRQPAMKTVKSLCWRFSDGDVTWRIEGTVLSHPWIRFPAGDIEGEVPI